MPIKDSLAEAMHQAKTALYQAGLDIDSSSYEQRRFAAHSLPRRRALVHHQAGNKKSNDEGNGKEEEESEENMDQGDASTKENEKIHKHICT